jgi:hypothetical protein
VAWKSPDDGDKSVMVVTEMDSKTLVYLVDESNIEIAAIEFKTGLDVTFEEEAP